MFKKSPFDIEDERVYVISFDRLAFLQLGLLLVFCLIVVRLMVVVVFPKAIVKEFANKHEGVILRENPRGMIYDRSQNVLAYSVYTPSLFCSPADILYPEEMSERVAQKLGLELEDVKKRMAFTDSKGNKLKYVLLKRAIEDIPKADLEQFVFEINNWQKNKLKEEMSAKKERNLSFWEKILSMKQGSEDDEDKKPKGYPLFIKYEWLRQYPHHEVGGNVIGFVSMGKERVEGIDGIEKDWDSTLYASQTKVYGKKTGSGYIIPSTSKEDNGKDPGANLYLTIDLEIQHILEKELDRRIEECNAADGMGIIMDPYSGAILAMASRPSYDPNLPESRIGDTLKNKVLYELIEPGSTFKIVTASAGIEQGGITKDTIIDCEGGSTRVGRKVIRDVHKMGAVPFWKCFEQSSNVAMVKVGKKVGLDTLKEYVKKFGFGTKALEDISTERIGAISTNRAETTLSSMSIGYAVMVTPIQLARAYAVIANGGYLVKPYIVEKAILPSGEVYYEHKAESLPRVIQPETAELIRTLCHQVVLKGTGKTANIPEYKVGGKTGTAHLARTLKEGGGYDPDKIIAVFAGFAPVTHPKIVVVIVIRYPMSKIRYGGYVCGPAFKNVVYYTLTRLKVPPDPIPNELLKQDGFVAEESIEKDNDSLYFEDIDPLWVHELLDVESPNADRINVADTKNAEVIGETENHKKNNEKKERDVIINPLPVEKIIEEARQSQTLPQLLGLTKRQVLDVLSVLKIDYECRGYGRVASQFPAAGTPLKDVDICQLDFSDDIKSDLSVVSLNKEE